MSLRGVLMRKGAAAVFSHTTPGTYDPVSETWSSPTTVTVSGRAMQIDGDPDLYTSLGLIESDNPTLLFAPDTLGELPGLGYTVPWGNDPALTVKNIKALAMAGTPTAARIVVSR